MIYISTVTTRISIIAPFSPQCQTLRGPLPGFWEPGSTQTRIWRNSIARARLQRRENTVQSSSTANKLGAFCVGFNVQLTEGYIRIMFHDFWGDGDRRRCTFAHAYIRSIHALQSFASPEEWPKATFAFARRVHRPKPRFDRAYEIY